MKQKFNKIWEKKLKGQCLVYSSSIFIFLMHFLCLSEWNLQLRVGSAKEFLTFWSVKWSACCLHGRDVLSLDAPSFRVQRPLTILWGVGEYRTCDRVFSQQLQNTKKQELIYTIPCSEKQTSKGFYLLVREGKYWDIVDISAQMSEDMNFSLVL